MADLKIKGYYLLDGYYMVTEKVTIRDQYDTAHSYYWGAEHSSFGSIRTWRSVSIPGGYEDCPINTYIDGELVSVSTSESETFTWDPVDGATLNFTHAGDFREPTELNLYITTRPSYTLSYFTNHGAILQSEVFISDLTSDLLPTLSESGFVFRGWYYESSYTTQAQVGDVISANTVLYARWTPVDGSKVTSIYGDTKLFDRKMATPVSITYDNSVIATILEGNRIMLDIQKDGSSEALLTSPIIIGDAIIPDVNQGNKKWLFSNNISILVDGGMITDLTGYTWYGNDTPNSGFLNLNYKIEYYSDGSIGPFTHIMWNGGGSEGDLRYSYNSFPDEPYYHTAYSGRQGWDGPYRTIHITGGADATKQECIFWFVANGTLTKET